MVPIIRIALILFTVLIYSCSTGPGPTQAGSETTSGVEIEALGTTIRGKTTPGATVMIFDARYSPGDTLKAVTDTEDADDSGYVVFADLPMGKYNVFVYPKNAVQGAAVFGIPVMQNSNTHYADTVPFDSVKTIAGTVSRQGRPNPSTQVFIAGSAFYSETDSLGRFSFKEVPLGVYTVSARYLVKGGVASDSVSVDLSQIRNSTVTVSLELQ
jgi:hypothetical protein